MSEDEKNHEEQKGLKVKVQVSGKEEIERLKEELADRDAKLEMIAEKTIIKDNEAKASVTLTLTL